MGIQVTVDSDDLEKLLYATGAIKQIEHALLNRKSDPFYQSAVNGIASAHERLNKAWNNARRDCNSTAVNISTYELQELKNISTIGATHKMDDALVKSLRTKGLIEMGNTFYVTDYKHFRHLLFQGILR